MAGRPTAVGAYIFAGGFTVGVAQHFDVLAHVEGDGYGHDTFALNFPQIPCYWPPDKWPRTTVQVDFVYANPPCAPWSGIGKSLRNGPENWRTDERTSCFTNVLDFALDVQAKVVAVESVTNLLTRGREFAHAQAKRLWEAGYEVTFFKHDSVFWGLPQRRRRVFLVGSKVHLHLDPPPCTFRTARHVLAGLPDLGLVKTLEGRYLPVWEILALEPPTGKRSLRRAYLEMNKGQRKGSPRIVTHMANLDGPIGTIVGLTQLHPDEPRYLSEREMARLNGFPEWFRFYHNDSKHPLPAVASEIARGVNPVIAEYLARMVAKSLRIGQPPERNVLLVDYTAKGKGEGMVLRAEFADVTEQVLANVREKPAHRERSNAG